jgi:hypothetical protein
MRWLQIATTSLVSGFRRRFPMLSQKETWLFLPS